MREDSMGWQSRSRLPDLRDGSGPPQAAQLVRFDPVAVAVMVVDSILPGRPMPIPVGQGPPVMGQMCDWTGVLTEMRSKVADEFPDGNAPAELKHHVKLVQVVAAFQTAAMGLAAAAAELRKEPPKVNGEALPDAPAWKPKASEENGLPPYPPEHLPEMDGADEPPLAGGAGE